MTTDSGPLTAERIHRHIGDPRSIRWIELSSMREDEHLSCIDGRDERGIIGSPGGDSGQFLLALAAIEKTTGRKLDEADVTGGLRSHFDTFGHFYMHTDASALQALTEALNADPRLQAGPVDDLPPEDWLEFLNSPPEETREALLEHMVKPAHIGCGHIRLMVQNADEYGIREGLVVAFLRAIYRLWWAEAPQLTPAVLVGDHEESAVIEVRHEEGISDSSRIPLISPTCGGRQMFIHHPDVAAYLRREIVQYLARGQTPLGIGASQKGSLQETMDELSRRQLDATLGHLAPGLPIFEVVFAPDGTFEVQGASS